MNPTAPLNVPLEQLLDPSRPGIRYLAMRDLLDLPPNDSDLAQARLAAHQTGPIARILEQIDPAGYWLKPGPGYTGKYRSTVWAILSLAQLGARAEEDERIRRACAYLLDHALTGDSCFSYNTTPKGVVDCLHGNMCWSLVMLGYEDPRLEQAFDELAYGQSSSAHGDTETDFNCEYSYGLPCGWGAIKRLMALSTLPEQRLTQSLSSAIQRGVDFLFSVEPSEASYPTYTTISPRWLQFGFPIFYVADLLQLVETLVDLGYAGDARLARSLEVIREKQGADGFWKLEHGYPGRMLTSFGPLNKPNPYVSLRALRTLKKAGVPLAMR